MAEAIKNAETQGGREQSIIPVQKHAYRISSDPKKPMIMQFLKGGTPNAVGKSLCDQ
jgi:hypothetical protein